MKRVLEGLHDLAVYRGCADGPDAAQAGLAAR